MKTEPKIKITEHYAYGWVNPRVMYGSNPNRIQWREIGFAMQRRLSRFYRFIGWRKQI